MLLHLLLWSTPYSSTAADALIDLNVEAVLFPFFATFLKKSPSSKDMQQAVRLSNC